jgi:hypothetical protein
MTELMMKKFSKTVVNINIDQERRKSLNKL